MELARRTEPKMRLTVYSKDGCPFCSLLKHELRIRGIAHTEFDLSDDAVRAEFYTNTNTRTVPQCYLGETEGTLTKPEGESLGGWDSVSKQLDSLEKLLKSS